MGRSKRKINQAAYKTQSGMTRRARPINPVFHISIPNHPYHELGRIPHKRHTVFKKPDGGLYYEQLFGTEGFHGMSSLLYRVHRPTMIREVAELADLTPSGGEPQHFHDAERLPAKPTPDFLDSRISVLFNNDVNLQVAAPQQSMTDYFYKNADADEVLFIHQGEGTLYTMLGNLPFGEGDYLVIPRGMIYQISFETENNRSFVIESYSPVLTPKRYRNGFGQLLEHSPFCERDFPPPVIDTHDEKGAFAIRIKKQHRLHEVVYASHPFDVVGWTATTTCTPSASTLSPSPAACTSHRPCTRPLRRTPGSAVLPALVRLPPGFDSGAVQPQQHRFR